MRTVLTADHRIPDRAPLTIWPGDEVSIGERDTEWTAFIFVTGPRGAGWVPARHIDIHGATGTVLTAYNTTELPASDGETVEVLSDDRESGWAWCRNLSGREGWIPHRVLHGL